MNNLKRISRFRLILVGVCLMAGASLQACRPQAASPDILGRVQIPTLAQQISPQPTASERSRPASRPTPSLTAAPTAAPIPPLANMLVNIPAPSLAGNLLGDPTVQPMRVLLPPSYSEGVRRYPVVYMLPGFGGSAVADEYFTPQPISELFSKEVLKEMILVVVSGENRLGGSFYVNSPVTGNWEDFVTQDVIRYVDEHYRTIPRAEGRGISGHSMGGFGALQLAMRHPDLFGSVYAMSSGLFDKNGLADSHMFSPPNKIKAFLKAQAALTGLPEDEAIRKMSKADGPLGFTYAYGAAFAPQPDLGPPFFVYPMQNKDGELVRNDAEWKTWETGFGGLAEKVKKYTDNLRQLNGIVLDYGSQDDFTWIPRGSDYLSQLLTAAQVEHELLSYDGSHSSHIQERILNYVLPFFSDRLADPEIINK